MFGALFGAAYVKVAKQGEARGSVPGEGAV